MQKNTQKIPKNSNDTPYKKVFRKKIENNWSEISKKSLF